MAGPLEVDFSVPESVTCHLQSAGAPSIQLNVPCGPLQFHPAGAGEGELGITELHIAMEPAGTRYLHLGLTGLDIDIQVGGAGEVQTEFFLGTEVAYVALRSSAET